MNCSATLPLSEESCHCEGAKELKDSGIWRLSLGNLGVQWRESSETKFDVRINIFGGIVFWHSKVPSNCCNTASYYALL